MKRQKVLVQCIVNGEEVAEYVDPRESLLDMLRNHLGLTSVKKGCEVGECGACTVIIDGETIDLSCCLGGGQKHPHPRRSGKRRADHKDPGSIYRRRCSSVRFLYTGIYHVCDCPSGAGQRTHQR